MNTPNRQLHTWIRSNPSPLTGEVGPKGRVRVNPSPLTGEVGPKGRVGVIFPLILAFLAILLPAPAAAAATNLAVFNFQLKTGQEDWVWLEKFMSDQMATDLVQDRSLSVVARDRMQLMAQQMKWAPEFATGNEEVMGSVRSQLGIEYLVTGVCSVQDDQLEITAQIVEVQTRKEVHRKTVTGKTGQVIDLQKQLSADAMAWFTKKPAGEILKTLPMWTRSIPAVRALYEGMHLYDQGRYAEGWVKFRDASREDKNYVEAIYWVGKMYYFMYRYDHARRTLERFVYLDCLHPRAGDALMEYAHTFESTYASPEDLLTLYKAFGERFPNVRLGSGGDFGVNDLTGSYWAKLKSAKLLSQMGRHREVAILTGPAMGHTASEKERDLCIWSLVRHHALTCEVPDSKVLSSLEWGIVAFSPTQTRQERVDDTPVTITGKGGADLSSTGFELHLLAHSGYVFKSLRFEPIAEGDDAVMSATIYPFGLGLISDGSKRTSLAAARRDGITLEPPRRWGMVHARCSIASLDANSPAVVVKGISITATLEKVTEHGAIDVQCENATGFRVEVDGVFARTGPGVAGLLTPGQHTVTLTPAEKQSPYRGWTSKVNVEPGKVTRVTARLPWKDLEASRTVVTALVARDYDSYDLALPYTRRLAPAVQVDDDAIRVIWSRGDDLWWTISTDGNSFSAPRKLALPISTAWLEGDPRLLRDESGRFVLTFVSDRDEQHLKRVYFTWSRDFVNWSAPAMIPQETYGRYEFIQDSKGRYICVPNSMDIEILSSRDGYQWEPLMGAPDLQQKAGYMEVRLLPLEDGRLELYAWTQAAGKDSEIEALPNYCQLLRFVSINGQDWSPGTVIAEYAHGQAPWCISVARTERGRVLLATRGNGAGFPFYCQLASEDGGKWVSSGLVTELIGGYSSIAYHPRWGYVVAHGPYVIRSPQLPAVLARAAKLTPQPVIAKAVPAPAAPKKPVADRPATRPRAEVGKLTYLPGAMGLPWRKIIELDADKSFGKPKPDSGIVSPKAKVATVRHEGMTISLALDSTTASAKDFDVLRLDFSGKCDFKKALCVPKRGVFADYAARRVTTGFVLDSADFKFGECTVKAKVTGTLITGTSNVFSIAFETLADGQCMFGDKLHSVNLGDLNSDFDVNDVGRPGTLEGRDWVQVNIGDKHAGSCYGRPVLVDGELYNVTVSADGMNVSATKYHGPAGILDTGRSTWTGCLTARDDMFRVFAGAKAVPLPPGKYELSMYMEYSSTDPNKPGYTLFCGGSPVAVAIRDGQTTNVAIGSPVTAKLTAGVSGKTVTFTYTVRDVSGRRADVWPPNWESSPPPSVKIVTSDNRPVDRMKLSEWDWGTEGWRIEWKVREGLSGTFTATVECDSGPFIPKPATATFTVK